MKKTVSILIVLALALAMLAGCGAPAEPVSTELGESEHVVILVLDALSSSYLSQMGSNSNLAKIARAGAANLDARCVYPSHTLTNHATIMTGVSSGAHGIIGNVRLGEDGVTSIKSKEPETSACQSAQGANNALASEQWQFAYGLCLSESYSGESRVAQ